MCVYTRAHTHTHIYMYSGVYIYIVGICQCIWPHLVFIHLSLDGHLGCFHFLATVNSAAVNTGMDEYFQIRLLTYLVTCLRVGFLDHTISLILVFLKETPYCFSWWLYLSLEKAMAPHSSTLAWKIPWMEEPGRLQSMGLRRVGWDWANSFSLFTFMYWRRKWQPTPVFLPGEP